MASAGYSGTPIAKKLGVGPEKRFDLIDDQIGLTDILAEQQPEAIHAAGEKDLDVLVTFCTTSAGVLEGLARATDRVVTNGSWWISWPKKSSKLPSEITEQDLRDLLLHRTPWVDVKVCAVDENWSGLKFVRRLSER